MIIFPFSLEIPNNSTSTEQLKCFIRSGVRGATFSQTPMATHLSCAFSFCLAAGTGKPSRGDGWGAKHVLVWAAVGQWKMLNVVPSSSPGSVQVLHKKVQSVQAGGNITFSCQSVTNEDVIQVTWQKEMDGAEDNIATYSTMNGEKIAKAYDGHVSFAHSGLEASAISLHRVTLQDEGCYKCIFNTFPSGAVTGRMCLKVYGKTL